MASKEAEANKELTAKIEAVSQKNEAKRSRSQRRDDITFGLMGLFYLVLIVFALFNQSWGSALTTFGLALWAGLAYFLNRLINNQRFIIDQMFDLRELEQEEVQQLLLSLKPENLAPKPKAKAAKATK